MKVYGYTHDTKAKPLELYEVTLSAKPEVLRELASFIAGCADEIERLPDSWSHSHFTPINDDIVEDGLSVVIFNPNSQ